MDEDSKLLNFFDYKNKPESVQKVAAPFKDLAQVVFHGLPRSTERSMCLRKLVESKDCALRVVR